MFARDKRGWRLGVLRRLRSAATLACIAAASAGCTVGPDEHAPAVVLLRPSSVSLMVGGTAQLSVAAQDLSGNAMTWLTYDWGTSDAHVAAVSGSGLVTGVAPGVAAIFAASRGRSDSATVTVTALPPPPTTRAECTDPQPGWIWCDDFEQERAASYFEYADANGHFSRSPYVGVDGSYAMKAHFDAGQVNAGALHLAFGRTPDPYFRPVDAGSARYRELYWRVYLRNQDGWTGGGGDKLSRAIVFSGSDWSQAAIAHVWSGGTAETKEYLVLDPASGTDTLGVVQTVGYNDWDHMRWLGVAQTATPIFDAAHTGHWHCIEAHFRLNTAGLSDGVFELWIDGNPEAKRTGLNWVGSYDAYGINSLFLENYWNAGAPQAEDRYIDRLVVSTQPIGCATAH